MKRSLIPSLDDLRAFEAVARRGSVRAAAAELSLTHGAISRRLGKLAYDLRLTLFEKEGRGLKLSSDGEKLARACSFSFNHITETLLDIRQTALDKSIVLSCERSLAMKWLIPRLSAFQDQHPAYPVHLSVGGGTPDFNSGAINLAVRRIDFQIEQNWLVDNLIKEKMGPLMHPNIEHDWMQGYYTGIGTKTREEAWQQWLAQNPSKKSPKKMIFFDHHFLMIEAATAGMGVAMSPDLLARDDILSGRTIAPEGFQENGYSYGIIYPKNVVLSEGCQHLRSWLKKIANTL